MKTQIRLCVLLTAIGLLSGCPCGATLDLVCYPGLDRGDGAPPGVGPYLSGGGAPRVVPIGTPFLLIEGGRWDTNPTSIWARIQVGSVTVPAQAIPVDEHHLRITLDWPKDMQSGPAMLAVGNDLGTAPAQRLALVRFAFQGGTSMSTFSSISSNLNRPQWLTLGSTDNQGRVYVFDPPKLWDIRHPANTGTLEIPSSVMTNDGTSLGAFTDLDGDGQTDFVTANSLPPVDIFVRIAKQAQFTGGFSHPWKDSVNLVSIAAGPYDQARGSIVAADTEGNLYQCLFIKQSLGRQPCVKLGRLNENAAALWVGSFRDARSDILVLDVTRKLSLWRSDAMDQFTDQTAKVLAEAPSSSGYQALAVAEVDGQGGNDIVAVDRQGIVVFQNNGQGVFSAMRSDLAWLPAARSLSVGDLDGDGHVDLLITEAATGLLWALLNQGDDDPSVPWVMPGPIFDQASGQPLSIGERGIAILDGQPEDFKRGLLLADVAKNQLALWQNVTIR